MPPDRKERLEALRGWAWNRHEAAWESGFAALESYVKEHGDALVPRRFKTPDGFGLGNWIANQREDAMRPDRRERLQALKGWSGPPKND